MEKIISEIKNTTDKVVKKSGELIEMSKIKLSISSTKSDIGTQFKVLGELVYLGQKEEDSADETKIAETISKIDELYDRLTELNEIYAAIKNEKVCVFCGKSSPIDQPFCGGCGQKFPENDEPAQEGEVIDDITEVETV